MKQLIYPLLTLTVISCQSEKATTNISKGNIFEKPLTSVNVPLQVHVVNSDIGDTLYFANNTRVIVPKDSFVDSLGNPIKGEVEINFQEYRTEAEVILSGIPMQYDSAGTQYSLETDGMFKISGKQKGYRVDIAPDKSLKVKTQSYKEDTPCFNYYTQNKRGEWNYQKTKERSLDTTFTVKKEIEKLKKLDENSIGLDIEINYKKYPELKPLKNISWMYNGNEPDTLKLKLLANVNWDDFELQKTNENLYSYLLVGKSKKHSFSMPIAPAFSKEELGMINTLITEKIKNEELAYAQLKTQYEREAVINNFGTHNWDRCVYDDMILVNSILDFQKPIKYFYVINKNKKYRFVNKYNLKTINQIRFLKGGDIAIIAFLEGENKVACYAGVGMSSKQKSTSVLTIPLKENESQIMSSSDLQEIIDLI